MAGDGGEASDGIGALTVVESARRAGRYHWVEARLFEVLGGWVPFVPELGPKLLLASHAHHHAWRAELWRAHLPQRRHQSPDRLAPPPSVSLARVVDAVAEPTASDTTIEKLVGVYRVLVPHLATAYAEHRAVTNEIADAPIARTLKLVLADARDDWHDGEAMVQSMLGTPAAVDRGAAHHRRLERMLAAGGGIVGRRALARPDHDPDAPERPPSGAGDGPTRAE